MVAGKLAYTIEQRRQQEVVAAYDVATGREVRAHRCGGFSGIDGRAGAARDADVARGEALHDGRDWGLCGCIDREGDLAQEHFGRQRRGEYYMGDVGVAADRG